MDEIQKQPDKNNDEGLEQAKNALVTRRKVIKKSGRIGLLGITAAVFIGLGLPGAPIEKAQAMCGCGLFSCSTGCWGCENCVLGCTGTCYSFCASITN